jgi:hypothetical protein
MHVIVTSITSFTLNFIILLVLNILLSLYSFVFFDNVIDNAWC